MPKISFLIIGAQKAGTTSLFEYMQRHPHIYMPPGKEIAFFNRDNTFSRGWDWYLKRVTQSAPANATCGEASTYYMCGCPGNVLDNINGSPQLDLPATESLEEVIPRRIHQLLPDVKLICVLRDPVARAYSAYRMMVLERAEVRSFEDAVDQLMVPEAMTRARSVPTLTNGYVAMGEYCRILTGFLQVFPREQLMVIFTNELSSHPAKTLASIFEFIGVEADFMPDNLNTRYRAAAVKERIPGLHLATWQTNLARFGPARTIWHTLPEPLRTRIDRVSYRVKAWNAKRGEVDNDIPSAAHEKLRAHFWSDSKELGDLLDRDIPWLKTWSQ